MFCLSNDTSPVLKWAGGKARILPQLIPYFPAPFIRFLEPFVGAGAVFFSLSKKVPAVVNDSNAELVNLYEVIRDSPLELIAALDRLAHDYSEDFYYRVRAQRLPNKINQAARTIFLNKTGFNGLYRLNSKGAFNVPFGKRKKCPALYKRPNLLAVSERLNKARILNLDFGHVLAMARKGDFVYCDPPYEPLTLTSSFTAYTAGGFPASEQIRLKRACEKAVKRGAVVAVSNSSSPFIRELYSDWTIHRIAARRAINCKATRRGEIDEILAVLAHRSGER
ncbi:MAG: DNA adenine methylase [Deltaproteobacteria bacterium]|nr:DNA adenine methylase [Deltaproteobacteria bacterium]